jgi:predicted outer membrane repeat protein
MNHLIRLLILLLGFNLPLSALSNNKDLTTSNMGVVDRFYVGSDNDCDFLTIQAAINAANSSQNPPEILIADNKNYIENLNISLNNILIDGSFANCTDARNGVHGGNKAKLKGFLGTQFASIKITGLFVIIKNIQLDTNTSGGILANATSVITLENLLFFQLGDSAIKIEGDGPIDLKIKNSLFLLNSATRGAAINCSGIENTNILFHSIEVTDGSGFANNFASTGGAVDLRDGCSFSMFDGGFQNNNSAFSGGAIAAYKVEVDLNRVTFTENISGGQGGAIVAEESQITANASRFIRNESTDIGGAIAINPNSTLKLESSMENCINSIKCSLFDGNKSTNGGAINSFGNIDISSTYFENNRANVGTALSLSFNTITKIEGSVFNHNGNHAANGFDDRNVIYASGDQNTTISYTTFADNKVLFSTFKQEFPSFLNVYSSIIYDPSSGDVFDSDAGSNQNINCLIVHEDQSFDANNAFVTVADPMFVDATNGDYHINAAISPAVDYCTNTQAMAVYQDIDFQNRGFDDPDVTNLGNNPLAIYDIGADESYGNDIFKNGFE